MVPDPPLDVADPEIAALLAAERRRQRDAVRLIASENYAPRAVLEASASVLNNKYSEGYPGRRYYEGQQNVDPVETLAVERLKKLFGAEHANVQPYSGSPANLAVYLALARPGDVVMGLGLPHGGHLTHGWNVSVTGIWFRAVQYGVRPDDHRIDFDEVARLARENRPRLLWCGGTAYPRIWDWARFAEIARDVGAVLVADMAHVAGLVAGGVHPSPVGIAEVVTSTTHKTFRGPRGGMILCDASHAKAIDRAVFPGLQGGPHNATTAAIAVAAALASTPDFRDYARQIVDNARAMADVFRTRGIDMVTGGTDNHLILLDLRNRSASAKTVARALDRAGIETNCNSVPFDPRKPFDPSGLRIGTAAITSRGMKQDEARRVAGWICDVIESPDDERLLDRIRGASLELCAAFPPPGIGHD
ncbi:MAG: serine hydroxymethyltransferase [Myxococcales bacterium]|nr:serine hydroxymethyltransferase [Myxococcales bacterium]